MQAACCIARAGAAAPAAADCLCCGAASGYMSVFVCVCRYMWLLLSSLLWPSGHARGRRWPGAGGVQRQEVEVPGPWRCWRLGWKEQSCSVLTVLGPAEISRMLCSVSLSRQCSAPLPCLLLLGQLWLIYAKQQPGMESISPDPATHDQLNDEFSSALFNDWQWQSNRAELNSSFNWWLAIRKLVVLLLKSCMSISLCNRNQNVNVCTRWRMTSLNKQLENHMMPRPWKI